MPAHVALHFIFPSSPPAHAKSVPIHFSNTPGAAVALMAVVSAPVLAISGLGPANQVFFAAASGTTTTWAASAGYDNNVFRGPSRMAGEPWQVATPNTASMDEVPWQMSTEMKVVAGVSYEIAQPTPATHTQAWEQSGKLPTKVGVPWEEGASLKRELEEPFQGDLPHLKPTPRVVWEKAAPVPVQSIAGVHEEALPIHRLMVSGWKQAQYLSKHMQYRWAKGSKRAQKFRWVIPWGEARRPYPGVSAPPPTPPGPVPPETYSPGFHGLILHFVCPWLDYWGSGTGVPLHFGLYPCDEAVPPPPEGGVITVPVRTVYMILNQISMKRVSDNVPVEISSATMSTDQGSWAWSFRGVIPAKELSKVEPSLSGPVEVQVTINGISWNFYVESYRRRRQFGDHQVEISGRSTTALLDAPYAPVRSYVSDVDYYAKALAQAELDRVPGPTWLLDWPTPSAVSTSRKWDADDGLDIGWEIPAGLYSYADLTPMQAINYLVQSVGGYVQSDRTAKKIIVNSGYPVGPWSWASATPDIIIPKDVLKADSLQWEEKPQYNRVYVTGKTGGVNALVRRLAFTPDLQAPQYVHELIANEYAAREKGKTVIADGGKSARMTLDVPFDPTIGLSVISPGMLVRFTDPTSGESDWRGLSRSVQISASANEKEITVTQSVQLERHYY